jgi:hypothetical protein
MSPVGGYYSYGYYGKYSYGEKEKAKAEAA